MSDYEEEIKWPKHYKPLPPGYKVAWSGSHYYWHTAMEEGPICWNRYWVRRWAFAHYKEAQNQKGEKG